MRQLVGFQLFNDSLMSDEPLIEKTLDFVAGRCDFEKIFPFLKVGERVAGLLAQLRRIVGLRGNYNRTTP
jgi:hypothetical protein